MEDGIGASKRRSVSVRTNPNLGVLDGSLMENR